MKREAVFDSSTAILLAKVQLLGIAAERLNIFFSEAVKDETTNKDTFDSKLIIKLINENKIKVVKANQSNVNVLIEDFNIEKGEAESIEIASAKKCILATDDGPCIKSCRILGIKFATAIHFLISFYEKKLDDVVTELVNKKIAIESEGAIVVLLDDLPPALIQKSIFFFPGQSIVALFEEKTNG